MSGSASNLAITIKDNTFLNSPADAIAISAGVVTGNYFSGEGYAPGAHADAIYVPDRPGPPPSPTISSMRRRTPDAPGPANSDIRITNEFGNTDNVTVSGNYLLGAGFTVEAGSRETPLIQSATYRSQTTTSDFSVYGPYSPGTDHYRDRDRDHDRRLLESRRFDQGPGGLCAGLRRRMWSPTTTSLGHRAVTPTTILGIACWPSRGPGETNFVGGFGAQFLFGGQGANILTYLAIGDGGDRASAFDPAKDVIDLSHIDADITTAGVQNFTFIGSAPFSGGAQVRYQLNPTNDTTLVQAALAGDTTADFTITLAGLVPLTAANFALTPSQSSADLANGAALSFKKVTTAAGAPTEYAYSNVQGQSLYIVRIVLRLRSTKTLRRMT